MGNGVLGGLLNTSSFLAPVILVVVLSVLAVAFILVFLVKNVMPVIPFLYANARIHSRVNYIVSNPLLYELAESKSLKEFRGMLRETSYGEELEKSKDDLRSVHAALEKASTESVLELAELSPEKSKPLLKAYFMFLEAKVLKIFYRAKFFKVDLDESLVYPVGIVTDNLLRHLVETETVADISVVMAPTPYMKVFEPKYSSLEEFEVAIDKFVFDNFIKTIKKTRMYDSKYIIDILNKKIDIANILAMLKFRVRGIRKEKQRMLLVDNNTPVCLRFEKLIETEALKDFVNLLKGTPYYMPAINALEKYEKDNSLSHFENELNRFFKKAVIDNDLSHTLGPYPLFSHLLKREIELKNLFVISRGIDVRFSVDKMKEMII